MLTITLARQMFQRRRPNLILKQVKHLARLPSWSTVFVEAIDVAEPELNGSSYTYRATIRLGADPAASPEIIQRDEDIALKRVAAFCRRQQRNRYPWSVASVAPDPGPALNELRSEGTSQGAGHPSDNGSLATSQTGEVLQATPKPVRPRIKATRNRLGLTQAQLAKELGIARTTVSRWEAGGSGRRSALTARVHDRLCELRSEGYPPSGSFAIDRAGRVRPRKRAPSERAAHLAKHKPRAASGKRGPLTALPTAAIEPAFAAATGNQRAMAARIIALRARLGLTRGDLAAKLNISVETVGRWERHGPPRFGSGAMAVERVERLLIEQGAGDDFRTRDDLIGAMIAGFSGKARRAFKSRVANDGNPRGRWFRAFVRTVFLAGDSARPAARPPLAMTRFLSTIVDAWANNPRLLEHARRNMAAMREVQLAEGPNGLRQVALWPAIYGLLLWEQIGVISPNDPLRQSVLDELLLLAEGPA